MRLVNADTVADDLKDLIKSGMYPKIIAEKFVPLVHAIQMLPRVDAEPVRHGWWERYDIGGVLLNCSECKAFSPHGVRTRYCPWCGAKMEDEDDN